MIEVVAVNRGGGMDVSTLVISLPAAESKAE